jgi:NAD-dependent dihydropyrimidine dehydrogenase PreA subunit
MSYVVTSKCAGTCDTACVDVCPCDCIEGLVPLAQLRALPVAERGQMFIDPDRCIDCGACAQECPADAIYLDDDVPAEHRSDIARNRDFFAARSAEPTT